jgi:N-acetylmuramoyl-L-alanine amidase
MSEVPIRLLSREEFSRLLRAFKATAGTRRINSVHIHHTWIPNYDHFDRQKQRLGSAAAAGRELCANMRRSHMNDRGFRDIAQHLTIDPEGNLYLGRAWNLSPASALGFNGSAQVGPFMIEMIGDFDIGRNKMTVAQREATVWVTATVNAAYDLAADSIRFHNEMAAKSCPGTSQSRATWVAEVARGMKETDPTLGQPFDARYVELQTLSLKDALSEMVAVSRDLKDEGELPSCSRDAAVVNDFIEPIDSAWLGQDDDLPSGRGGPKLSDQDLREVRPHIINMRQGRFSNDGIVQSTLASVTDQMSSNFGHWARARHAAGQPVRVMFFAHGGLVSEKNAVAYAVATREFWLSAGVWPFFFVWETGPLETLAQIFSRSRQSGTRAARGDLDRVWEGIASGPGTKLWETMKLSAERSGQPDGSFMQRR